MEDILKLLKKLKQIEPDKDYAALSRQKILNEINKENFNLIKVFRSFCLAFATFIIIIGLFLIIENVTPKFGALNPSVIKTEAEAIDFQIQLSKLIYNTNTQNSSKILNSVLNKKTELENKAVLDSKNSSTTESATSFEKITVDEALDYIAK